MLKSLVIALLASRTALSQPMVPTEAQLFLSNTPVLPQVADKIRTDTEAMMKAPLRHPQAISIARES